MPVLFTDDCAVLQVAAPSSNHLSIWERGESWFMMQGSRSPRWRLLRGCPRPGKYVMMEIITNSPTPVVDQHSLDLSSKKWKTKRWKWRQRDEFDIRFLSRMMSETCRREADGWRRHHPQLHWQSLYQNSGLHGRQWVFTLCEFLSGVGRTHVFYFSQLFGYVYVFVCCFL